MANPQKVKPALGTSEFTERVGKMGIFELALALPGEKPTSECNSTNVPNTMTSSTLLIYVVWEFQL